MASNASPLWYIYTANGRQGPVSIEAVQALIEKGALKPHDFAWCVGMSNWKKISEIDVLRGSIREESSIERTPLIRITEPSNPALSPLDDLAANTITPLELETQTDLNANEVLNKKPRPAPASASLTLGRRKKSFLSSIPGFLAAPVITSIVLGTATYFAYPYFNEWRSPFPRISELSPDQYALLKKAAKADLKTSGPKVEMLSSLRNDGGSTFFIATNLADHTPFDLAIQPIPETLVGEPREIQPLHLSSKRHLARAGVESVPPGYYWVNLTSPLLTSLSIRQKVFLGGSPDLSYQTHLKDYMAVKRGIAKAELDRIRDALTKIETLVSAEHRAAESIGGLRIPQARVQAWDMYQSTWNRVVSEIQGLLSRPSRFSGKLLRETQSLQEPVKKLHDKYHELVAAVVTPESRQLSAGSVTSARVFADAQVMTNDIASRLKALRAQADERGKRFENSSEPVSEEP